MNSRIFLTFGDGDFRYRNTAKRIAREAHQTGLFDSIHCFDLHWLSHNDPEIYNLIHPWIMAGDIKGIGYWAWKTSILRWASKQYPLSLLCYMDAGNVILKGNNAQKTLTNWMIEAEEMNGLTWQLPNHMETQWTKIETLKLLDPQKIYWNSEQLEASFLMQRSSRLIEYNSILRDSILLEKGFYLKDELREVPMPDFIDHRRDQSMHSLIWKKLGFNFRTTETAAPGKCDCIHAARYISIFSPSKKKTIKILQFFEFYIGKAQKFFLIKSKMARKLAGFSSQ